MCSRLSSPAPDNNHSQLYFPPPVLLKRGIRRKNMRSFLVILLILSIGWGGIYGCAPSTAAGVRSMGPERQFVFIAPENYQPVYRKVLDQARKCFQMGLITAQQVVQGDLYHDTRSGTITVALHGGLGVDTYQVIDVSAIDDNQTRVIGHYSLGPVDKYGQILKEWVLENSTECGLKSRP